MSTNPRPRTKRFYKERFRHEDPFVAAPKTTKWRLRKTDMNQDDADGCSQNSVDGHDGKAKDDCVMTAAKSAPAISITDTDDNFMMEHDVSSISASSESESEPDTSKTEDYISTNMTEESRLCHPSSSTTLNVIIPRSPTLLSANDACNKDTCSSPPCELLCELTASSSPIMHNEQHEQLVCGTAHDLDMPTFNFDTLTRLKVSINACTVDPWVTNSATDIDQQEGMDTANRVCIAGEGTLLYFEPSPADEGISIEDRTRQDHQALCCNSDEEDPSKVSQAFNEDDLPLFHDAQISKSESALLTLTFALRHDLSGECLSDLLRLLELHCPPQNSCDTSLHLFRNHVKGLKSPVRCHRFCSNCNMFIGEDKSISICPNSSCSKNFTPSEDMPYFLEIPIVDQLNNMFKRPNFHQDLLHRFSTTSKCTSTISDIYDGSLYQKQCQPGGFLSNTNHISFMWYVDGAQLFKSSKGSLWVLYLAINELPYAKRMNPDNIILGGLWFNDGKPCMSSFLKPFCESLNELYSAGCDVFCGHCRDEVTIKAMVLCGTCDLPAKAGVMNMTQFNGEFGCPVCCQPGKVVEAGRGHTRVYPFDVENTDGPLRNNAETIQHAVEASATGKPVQGMKGPSWFSTLEDYDLIQGTGVDYMHGVLLGVVRQLLKLWFTPKYSSLPFSCCKRVDEVDERLLSIRPPSYITRLPRSIKQHVAYWKANECRAWLLFYSVPALCGVLSNDYYQHHLLIVEAIHILCKVEISQADLVHCRRVLIHYVATFGALYSDRHMTINVHQLLHLVNVVQNLGPLWVYSCFSFESLNGKLLKLVHGANKPVLQIANAVTSMLRIPELGGRLVPNSKAASLYGHFQGRGSKRASAVEIEPEIYMLGKLKMSLSDEYLNAVNRAGAVATSMFSFLRVRVKDRLVCSSQYVALKSRDCSVVMLRDGSFGRVEIFLKCCSCDCSGQCNCESSRPRYFALVRKMDVAGCVEAGLCCDELTEVSLPQVQLVRSMSEQLLAIQIGAIMEVCVYVCIGLEKQDLPDLEFVVIPPNCIECD